MRAVRQLEPEDLSVVDVDATYGPDRRLRDRSAVVLVGLTGAGKTTTVERLADVAPLAALLPDRRALTDRLILPMMTGSPAPVTDRVERFRLTAAFKERHPGGMGDVLGWLVLPPGLPEGPVLFDGLRGEAEAVAAAATLPAARFLVLDCSPEGRLRRLCGRNDPFDRASAVAAVQVADGPAAVLRAMLASSAFDTLVASAAADSLASELAAAGAEPAAVARMAAIIVEESRHYDPAAARAGLLRAAAERTLVVDTDAMDADRVVASVLTWLARDPVQPAARA